MKKLLCCVIGVFATSVSVAQGPPDPPPLDVFVTNEDTSPVPVSPQTIVEWRYVGLTTGEDDGSFEFGGLEGVAGMNKMCAADYGPGARAATIAEAFFRDDAATETREGWLVPGGPLMTLEHGSDFNFTFDASTGITVGRSGGTQANSANRTFCVQYGSASVLERAPVTFPTGLIDEQGCSVSRPVACSVPVAIPVVP